MTQLQAAMTTQQAIDKAWGTNTTQGYYTDDDKQYSHAEGEYSNTTGACSHTEGKETWHSTQQEDNIVYAIDTEDTKPVRTDYQQQQEDTHNDLLSDTLYDVDYVLTHGKDSHQEWWDNYYKEYGKV